MLGFSVAAADFFEACPVCGGLVAICGGALACVLGSVTAGRGTDPVGCGAFAVCGGALAIALGHVPAVDRCIGTGRGSGLVVLPRPGGDLSADRIFVAPLRPTIEGDRHLVDLIGDGVAGISESVAFLWGPVICNSLIRQLGKVLLCPF